ncbi:MAG: toxin-antitoxin system YwqK family antitoxin [Bacteroidota bacterium]
MTHKPFPALITLIILSSCGSNLSQVEDCDEQGYCERYFVDSETGLRQGKYEVIGPNGKVQEVANYTDGQLDGIRAVFASTGDTVQVETYENGQFSGPFRLYETEEGYLRQSGQYVNGVMSGSWYVYHPNGQVSEEVTFADNQEQGPFKEWYASGQLKAEGFYLDGDNEHGELWIYAENGDLERLMDCSHGVCSSLWRQGDPGPVPQKD